MTGLTSATLDTPRTNAHLSHLNLPGGGKVGLPDQTVALLRELERDFNAKCENAHMHYSLAAKWAERARALAEALRTIRNECFSGNAYDIAVRALDADLTAATKPVSAERGISEFIAAQKPLPADFAKSADDFVRAEMSSAARESSDPCVVLTAERIEQLRVVLREWSSSEPDRLAIDLGHLCNMAQMCGDAPEPSSAPAARESSEPLSDDDFYWLEKLISDVESPDQRKYITGFSPMRLNFMAKMLRRALQNAAPQAVGVGPAIQPSPSDAADRPAGAAPPAACTLDKYKGTPEQDLSEKPASPLPWTLHDNVIRDANGEPVCGEDMPEFDADFIYRAVVAYTTPPSSMRTEEMSASDPTRTQPMSSTRAGTEPCSYCGVEYPKPVSYHHSTEECHANEKASSTRATPVAYAWIDDASDRMRRAKAWLDVAADSGIDAKDEMGLPTPNAEGCALLAAEIDSLLSGVPTPNRDLGFGSPADKAAGIASASPSSTRATGNTPRCDALDEEIVQIRMARGVSLGRDLKEFKNLARQLERELADYIGQRDYYAAKVNGTPSEREQTDENGLPMTYWGGKPQTAPQPSTRETGDTPRGTLAGTYRWIQEAVPFLQEFRATRKRGSEYNAVNSLLMGVPSEPQDLGFDSPADRFARWYHAGATPASAIRPHDWQPDGGVLHFESHPGCEAPHVHATCSHCGGRAWFTELQWEMLGKGCVGSSPDSARPTE